MDHIDDETGKAALAACIAAAFGDPDDWQASIPARDDDSDIVASRWARQLLARAEAAEARLAHAERELLVIQDSMEQSRDPYDRGAYAICEDVLAILRGRVDDIEPEQGGEE